MSREWTSTLAIFISQVEIGKRGHSSLAARGEENVPAFPFELNDYGGILRQRLAATL
jgi:hypothetical protein